MYENVKDDSLFTSSVVFYQRDILQEVEWFFRNVKVYNLPHSYRELLKAAVHYSVQGKFYEALRALHDCTEMRKEYGAF